MDFLTVTIFLPALGALVIMLHKDERYIRGIALLFSVSTFVLSLPLWFGFDAAKGPYAASIGDLLQFEVDKPWVEALNIRYHIGLDGIALLLYMLTTFLTPLCIWGSFPVIKGKLGGKHRDTPPSPPPQAGGETLRWAVIPPSAARPMSSSPNGQPWRPTAPGGSKLPPMTSQSSTN